MVQQWKVMDVSSKCFWVGFLDLPTLISRGNLFKVMFLYVYNADNNAVVCCIVFSWPRVDDICGGACIRLYHLVVM